MPARRDRSPVRRLVLEWLDDTVGADGRLWRSLGRLVGSPGTLTESYLAGSDRYIRPTRLYLLTSLALFGLTSAADPGSALGEAMLAQERAWLASDDPSAVRELEEDLQRLGREVASDRADAEQRTERIAELLDAVRRGERRAEAAAFVAGSSGEEARGPGTESWLEDPELTEEDLARAQSATAGRLLEWLPLALILLVPVHAAGVHGLTGRPRAERRRSGVAAVVLSLHAHALGYVALSLVVGVAWLSGWSAAPILLGIPTALLAVLVWQAAALGRVYGTGWRRAAGVAVGWGALYGVVVLVVFVGVYGVALATG